NGVDESQCFELEINECNGNECRCYNGNCIPKMLLDESFQVAACLDRSDFWADPDCPSAYLRNSIFECTEYCCDAPNGVPCTCDI
ncbi:unnamed protein product, partial [Adineta steineri]